MMTEKGQLLYGLEWPAGSGRLHFDFEVRLPTLGDNIAAIEEVGADDAMRLSASMLARSLTRLGDIPAEDITTGLLENHLVDEDFDTLSEVRNRLKKKRTALKNSLPTSASSPLSLAGTASAKTASTN